MDTQQAQAPETRPAGTRGRLDDYFGITARRSTVGREVRGGIVTFFTMAYIIVLNPLILGFAPDADGNFLGGGSGDGSNLAAIAAGTALVAGVMTILMGAVANYPLALATGLGLNAFVAFGIASLDNMTWADAMGLVVLEGLIILALVLTGLREAVFRAIPAQLKVAISVGIGLFILPRTYRLARQAVRILVQAAPAGTDLDRIESELLGLDGVVDVHDLHLWTLTSGMHVATAHLVCRDTADPTRVLTGAASVLRERFAIEHATIQVEPAGARACVETSW